MLSRPLCVMHVCGWGEGVCVCVHSKSQRAKARQYQSLMHNEAPQSLEIAARVR